MTNEQESLMRLIRLAIWVAIVVLVILAAYLIYLFPSPAAIVIAGAILLYFMRELLHHDQ